MILIFLAIAFALTVIGVWLFRRVAAKSPRLLDHPNERSSHKEPVIRGAGIIIVLTVLSLYAAACGNQTNVLFVVSALSIAAISFLDDLFRLPLILRLAVHIAAASAFVYYSGAYAGLTIPGTFDLPFGAFAPLITILFIVGTTNAYNFMDGVDGVAAVQGVGAGLGWMLYGYTVGSDIYSILGGLIVGSCLGFLIFNWQPAKVFMGDVGSTFLGFTLGVFPLIDSRNASEASYYGLALAAFFLFLFLFDTALTRGKQIAAAKPFWRPHRDHLYQRIVINGYSHAWVAFYFGFFAITGALAVYLTTATWMPIGIAGAGAIGLVLWSRKRD